MDRTTKKLFKYIYKNPTGININHLNNIFPNKDALNESYEILLRENLVIYRDDYITLTVKGYDYYYNQRKNFAIKILKALISPIVVAVVTSFITAKIVSPTNDCHCDVTCDYTNSNDISNVD